MLLPAALFGVGAASAEPAPAPPGPPTTIVVLDASSSMKAKIGGASKLASVQTALGQAVAKLWRSPVLRPRGFWPSQGVELRR